LKNGELIEPYFEAKLSFFEWIFRGIREFFSKKAKDERIEIEKAEERKEKLEKALEIHNLSTPDSKDEKKDTRAPVRKKRATSGRAYGETDKPGRELATVL
jgi:hypothetical protein